MILYLAYKAAKEAAKHQMKIDITHSSDTILSGKESGKYDNHNRVDGANAP